MQVEHWNAALDGRFSEATLRRKLECQGYQVNRYTYSPGTYFPAHTHDLDKIDAVVSGTFRLIIDGQSVLLQAGDYVAVHCGEVHSAEVIGPEPVISLDGVRIGPY